MDVSTLIPTGARYRADVPDTLDLAERARIGLNGLVGSLDHEGIHEMYFIVGLGCTPPYMYKDTTGWPTNNPKFAESFPMMRVMSGSDHGVALEADMMRVMLEAIGDDGLFYAKVGHGRPWHEGVGHTYPPVGEDFANTYGNARMLLALMAWHARSPDPGLWKRMSAMAHGLCDMAIDKGTYAYHPDGRIGEAFSRPRSGWRDTAEPAVEKMGAEGSMFMYHGGQIRALSRWNAMSGDRRSIEMAAKLVRFVLQHKFWGTPGEPAVQRGAEHGHFDGHIHAHLSVLRGLLEYATVARDRRIGDFAREGYEYARHSGLPQVGWFANGASHGWCEGCTMADMVALALRLSDAGLGDYHEDAEMIVRNNLAGQQLVDPARLAEASRTGPARGPGWDGTLGPHKHHPGTLPGQTVTEGVLERALGIFAGCAKPDGIPYAWTMQCCTGNGTQGLYYAWEAIVRERRGLAEVNLLLNRASPWLDVESWLPYEGRVVLRPKTVYRVALRLPRWVMPDEAKVEGVTGGPQVVGRHLVVDTVPGVTVEIRFPVPGQTATYIVDGTAYTFRFRGNDVVSVEPRTGGPGYYPMYTGGATGAPTCRSLERYVTPTILPW